MRTELLGQEKNVVRVKVEFEAEEFMARFGELIRELTQNANIPGFRKGRIPRNILEMRFGKENLHREALEKMLPQALKQVTEDYDLDIMETPSIKIDDIHEGQPVTCELVIEVRPEVELPELEEIEIERVRQEVSDETIEEVIDGFRQDFAELNPVERAAGDTDVVSASCTTHFIEPEGSETSAVEPYDNNIDLSAPEVRPEIKAALLGKSKGDEVSAEFDIEPEFGNDSLAGKRIRYDIKVNAVNEKILPEMNPEFFKRVLNSSLDTEEEFRTEMRTRMLRHQESDETARVCEAALTAITSRSKLDVPDSLLGRQAARIKEQDAEDTKKRYNTSMETYLGKAGISPAQYEVVVSAKAENMLRRFLVMDELGDKFGVEVTNEDIESEISNLSAIHGIERAKLRSHYYKNEDNMSELSNALRYDKINKALLEKIKIKEVDKLSEPEPAQGENAADAGADTADAKAESAE